MTETAQLETVRKTRARMRYVEPLRTEFSVEKFSEQAVRRIEAAIEEVRKVENESHLNA